LIEKWHSYFNNFDKEDDIGIFKYTSSLLSAYANVRNDIEEV